MKYQAVMPFTLPSYYEKFKRTVAPEFLEHILFVDNSRENVGIMRAHNMGVREMRKNDADWLIVMGSSIRFGKPGGMDFIKALEDAPANAKVIEAAGVYGWHLIAFRREVIDRVGLWDENFTPYGYDDLDYSYRFQLAYGVSGQLWDKRIIEVSDMGMAHSIKRAGVRGDEEWLQQYYRAKWGGMSGQEIFQHPYSELDKDVNYWRPARNGGQYND